MNKQTYAERLYIRFLECKLKHDKLKQELKESQSLMNKFISDIEEVIWENNLNTEDFPVFKIEYDKLGNRIDILRNK